MTARTLVVTGSSGFIGAHVLRVFRDDVTSQGDRVILLRDDPLEGWQCVPARRLNGIYGFRADDFTAAGITRIDALLHLGSAIPKTQRDARDVSMAMSNVLSTDFLLRNLPVPPQRVVYVSSVDVYAPSRALIDEQSVIAPVSAYGHSKLFCEAVVAGWCEANQNSSLILRLGHVYGEGEYEFRKLIPETIRRLVAGKAPVIFTTGSEKRPYLHAHDCARMLVRSLSADNLPALVNVAAAEAPSVREIVQRLCEIHRDVSGIAIRPKILGEAASGRDLAFDVQLRDQTLGTETVTLGDGLRREYLYQVSRAA